MRLQALKSVWLVMHNEWQATITKPLFWYATCMTPLMLVAIYLLFQWILDEDPREALLKEENIKSWEFFLEQELFERRGGRTERLNYAVLDPGDELASEIREEVLENDWNLFLLTVFDMSDDEFDSFRQSINEGDSKVLQALENERQVVENFFERTIS